jgi:3',5'-cyclic AMP phosphodiesterase CpdA
MKTVLHLSDLHFGRIDPAVLAPLCRAISELAPDLIAISGDFTQRARRGEFAAARTFLDGLQAPKLLVPGNHDVPLWNPAARLFAPLRRYQAYISAELEPEYVDDEMIVVGVNTARSVVLGGGGRINAHQVERIMRRLADAPPSLLRMIVTHHPFDLPPGVGERRLLGRAPMAMAMLAAVNADLFLSGHLHLSHVSRSAERYRIGGHSSLIVQAGTVSRRGRGEQPSFNILHVQRQHIELSKFVWNPVTSQFTRVAAGEFQHSDSGWIADDGIGN